MNRPEEKRYSWLLLIAVGIALLSAAAGASLWQMLQGRVPETVSLLILPEPRPMVDFELTGADGNSFTEQNLVGKWSLVFFGFTNCPDVCPSTLYELQQIHASIGPATKPGAVQHQVLFISVDAERDTPDRLREYLAYFDPDFLGATGTQEQLLPLTRRLGIAFRIDGHEEEELQYTVDHSASVLLLDPSGQLYGVFTAPHNAEVMVSDLAGVIYRDS